MGSSPSSCLKCSLGCTASEDVSNLSMPVVALWTDAGVQQEVSSQSEVFSYPKLSSDHFPVVITRTYPRQICPFRRVTIISQVSELRMSLLVSSECLSDSMFSFNLMAPNGELKISQYPSMTVLLSGMIGFCCGTFFVLSGLHPHDFQAIRALC